ncbi:MAG: LacI family DNA-binding transcriptional regulator [Gammaproteobacteria bacterium]|nr:LacI family DNA-binding transcriptional regulator [Gammaproteobacteria bacterium]
MRPEEPNQTPGATIGDVAALAGVSIKTVSRVVNRKPNARDVTNGAKLLGVDVSGQLSIAGCDDISLARQLCPTLTTIRQPLSSMAEHAAMVLIGDGQGVASLQGTEVVQAMIKIRESTGPAPG